MIIVWQVHILVGYVVVAQLSVDCHLVGHHPLLQCPSVILLIVSTVLVPEEHTDNHVVEVVVGRDLYWLGNLMWIHIRLQVLNRLVFLDQSCLFFSVQAVSLADRHFMSIPCRYIVLLVFLVIIVVHVFHVNGVVRLPWHLTLCLALVRIVDGWVELVGVVAVRWDVLLGRVYQWEALR